MGPSFFRLFLDEVRFFREAGVFVNLIDILKAEPQHQEESNGAEQDKKHDPLEHVGRRPVITPTSWKNRSHSSIRSCPCPNSIINRASQGLSTCGFRTAPLQGHVFRGLGLIDCWTACWNGRRVAGASVLGVLVRGKMKKQTSSLTRFGARHVVSSTASARARWLGEDAGDGTPTIPALMPFRQRDENPRRRL